MTSNRLVFCILLVFSTELLAIGKFLDKVKDSTQKISDTANSGLDKCNNVMRGAVDSVKNIDAVKIKKNFEELSNETLKSYQLEPSNSKDVLFELPKAVKRIVMFDPVIEDIMEQIVVPITGTIKNINYYEGQTELAVKHYSYFTIYLLETLFKAPSFMSPKLSFIPNLPSLSDIKSLAKPETYTFENGVKALDIMGGEHIAQEIGVLFIQNFLVNYIEIIFSKELTIGEKFVAIKQSEENVDFFVKRLVEKSGIETLENDIDQWAIDKRAKDKVKN